MQISENFDPATARQVDPSIIERVTKESLRDPQKQGLMIITQNSHGGWGYISGREGQGDLSKKLIYDMSTSRAKGGLGFTMVVDEIGQNANGRLSVSIGSPIAIRDMADSAQIFS